MQNYIDTFCLQNNDIALIKLNTPLTFSSAIKPICLSKAADDPTSGNAIVTGWGNLAAGK